MLLLERGEVLLPHAIQDLMARQKSVMQDSFEEVTDFITIPAARACATSVSCVFSL